MNHSSRTPRLVLTAIPSPTLQKLLLFHLNQWPASQNRPSPETPRGRAAKQGACAREGGKNGGRERREQKQQQKKKRREGKKWGWPVSFFSTIYSAAAGEVYNCCVTESTKKPDNCVLADGDGSGQEAGDSSHAGSGTPPLPLPVSYYRTSSQQEPHSLDGLLQDTRNGKNFSA